VSASFHLLQLGFPAALLFSKLGAASSDFIVVQQARTADILWGETLSLEAVQTD
jgi:hypothetical protein